MIPDDLRLQMGTDREVGEHCFGRVRFRFARINGWCCCSGWHPSVEAAQKCVVRRLRVAKRRAA